MKLKYAVICLSICLLIIGGCKKYEEGPGLSLRSKKVRVAGNWYVYETVEDNETTPSDDFDKELKWKFFKSGYFELKRGDNPADKGHWSFDIDKEILIITFDDGWGSVINCKIKKLKNKEMWLVLDSVQSPFEMHFHLDE